MTSYEGAFSVSFQPQPRLPPTINHMRHCRSLSTQHEKPTTSEQSQDNLICCMQPSSPLDPSACQHPETSTSTTAESTKGNLKRRALNRSRRSVWFPTMTSRPSPSSRFEEIIDNTSSRSSSPKPIKKNTTPSSSSSDHYTPSSQLPRRPYPPTMPPAIPELFTALPALRDIHETQTSRNQTDTAKRILHFMSSASNPLPPLDRNSHIGFLSVGLGTLPAEMTVLDASRPWLLYWCLVGIRALGESLNQYALGVVLTLEPLQNPYGGFGGGHGQLSHLAPSYAAVLSLALAGRDSLNLVDRVAMTQWLQTVYDASAGSFAVCIGGETDVRACYCALTIISLLSLPTTWLNLRATTTYLASCQTYEGGFAATPYGNEAHGGYAFCAMAALGVLHPSTRLARIIDLPGAARWLSARQYAPEGGLSGRTNKLVDGCYSGWVGGCWAFVEAGMRVNRPLWNREGLCRYILTATQNRTGGLRDKPGKGPDFYHSAYVLIGLSAAQYHHRFSPPEKEPLNPTIYSEGTIEKEKYKDHPDYDWATGESGLPLTSAFHWKFSTTIPGCADIIPAAPGWPDVRTWEDDMDYDDDDMQWEGIPEDGQSEGGRVEGGVKKGSKKSDRVIPIHPVFNIPYDDVANAERWAKNITGRDLY